MTGLAPGQGPSAALDEQHRLARWWRTDMAAGFAETFDASIDRRAMEEAGFRAPPRGAKLVQQERLSTAQHLRTCPTYSVTPDMVTVVEAAAKSYPGQPLHPDDLPSPTGFVLLDRPIQLMDIRGKSLAFIAFAWYPLVFRREEADGTVGKPARGIYLTMYSDLQDMVDYDQHQHTLPDAPDHAEHKAWDSPEELGKAAVRVFHPARLALLHVHGIQYDFEYDLSEVNILQNHLAFIEALFAIMAQRITLVSGWRAPRQVARALERATGEVPTVRIVTLRRAREYDRDPDAEPGFVEWSHRWMVSGHWRRLWNEERQQRRLVWVNPYIKGPEDKPLVVKDTVYRLSR